MRIKSGALNAQYGHAPRKHAEKIIRVFEDEKLDILLITESRDYNFDLSELARAKGFKLIVHRVRKDSDQVTALVRDPANVHRSKSFRAGTPYFRAGGGTMAAPQPLAVKYKGTWFIGVHAPVQAWVATRTGRRWIGPLLRRVSYAAFANRLVNFARNNAGPLMMLGDWNATPETRGRYSPNWIREQIHASFARPHESTGHGEIDFGIKRHLKLQGGVEAYFPKNFPGDHKFICMVTD